MLKSLFDSLYIFRERQRAEKNFRRSSYHVSHIQQSVRRDMNVGSASIEVAESLNAKLTPVGKIDWLYRLKRLLRDKRFRRRRI